MRIGVAGLGKMGSAIVERLIGVGLDVSVWNRSPAKAQALAGRGALAVSAPRDLVARSDVVTSILTDERAIDAV